MNDIAVIKLALRMVYELGVLKTSVFTNINQSLYSVEVGTLWCESKMTFLVGFEIQLETVKSSKFAAMCTTIDRQSKLYIENWN
jgi:DNA-binding MltR family transcriptional regulator